jgi:LPS-assembly lipoprotein
MKLHSSLLRMLMTLGIAAVLAGCGFALRGSQPLAAQGESVFLLAAEPASALAQTLREALLAADATLSPTPAAAAWQLLLGPETLISRPGSVNSRARAAQYDVELSVEITLEQQGAVALGPLRIASQRSYYEDISTIAGSNEEVVLLQQEMRQDLVQQLLRRLRAAVADTGA